jgi:hypothetical protein
MLWRQLTSPLEREPLARRFQTSGRAVRRLRVINSVARMKNFFPSAIAARTACLAVATLSVNLRDGMHDWVEANNRMATVLKAKGYPYQYVYSLNAGHSDRAVRAQTLPQALEWVWRGYPIQRAANDRTPAPFP